MIWSADQIEEKIREILRSAIVEQGEVYKTSLRYVQIRFFPSMKGEEMVCRYDVLVADQHKKELSFQEFTGFMYSMFKGTIEKYIIDLYKTINEREGIPISDIQILIQATAQNPTTNDLVANLYKKGVWVRELKVKEFVN